MSTIQTIIGPTSVKGSESWYIDQDIRWTTRYFAQFKAQATDVSPFQCLQTCCGTLPTSYWPSTLTAPHHQYVLFQTCHVTCNGGNITSTVCLNVLRKQLHILINSNLITSCKERFWNLHSCTYCTDTKHITATILNCLSVRHKISCKIAVSTELLYQLPKHKQ